MNSGVPQQLEKSPLFEALFETRFESSTPGMGDLLAGILYPVLKADYPEIFALPAADLPRRVRDQNPDLLFQPLHRLRKGPDSVSIGDRVVSLSSTAYPGWNHFRRMAESVLNAVESTGVVKRFERFSLRYINVLEASENDKQLSLFNGRIELAGNAPLERGFLLRTEKDEGNFTTVIKVSTRARGTVPSTGKEISGLLIDVDTICANLGHEFLASRAAVLDEAHSILKRTFFSLLTESTLEKLKPKW